MSVTSAKSGATGISLALDNNYMEPIATTVVGSTSVNSVVFNDIPQTYKHLQIRFMFRGTIADVNCDLYCWLNGDVNQANYSRHNLRGNGTAASAGGSAASAIPIVGAGTGDTATSGMFGVGIIDILDYVNTNKYKTTRSLTGEERNGAGNIWFFSTLYMNTNAITSLTLVPQSNGFAQYSRFSLYGIKG